MSLAVLYVTPDLLTIETTPSYSTLTRKLYGNYPIASHNNAYDYPQTVFHQVSLK